MDIGMFIVRIVVGLLFVGHGTQKLFGWFGGHGITGTAGWFTSLGYSPARPMAIAAGLGETIGGTLLTLGLFTPFGAAAVIGVMINAIGAVHIGKGLWNESGGYEYPLVLTAAAFAIAWIGPGAASVDSAMGLGLAGAYWGLFALLLGLVGGMLVLSSRKPEQVEQVRRREDRAA